MGESPTPVATSDPFDAIAEDYDRSFSDTRVGRSQRAVVHDHLVRLLGPRGVRRVLELNCGTGVDAEFLLEQGCDVVATDRSRAMVEVTSRRIGASDSARCLQLDLEENLEPLGGESFDLVFSNFGGLNCVSPQRLEELLDELVPHLDLGGSLVLVLMGRFCLLETLYFALEGDWRRALRRRRQGPVEAAVGDADLSIWYLSPGELRRRLPAGWRLRRLRAVGGFMPPSFLDPWLTRHTRLGRLLAAGERLLSRVGPLSALVAHGADHYLAEVSRTR